MCLSDMMMIAGFVGMTALFVISAIYFSKGSKQKITEVTK
jgi:hypothetical protein